MILDVRRQNIQLKLIGFHQAKKNQANKTNSKDSGTKYILCKYHSRFGANARRCEKSVNGHPCAMATERPPVTDSTSKPTVTSAGHVTQPIRKTGTIVVSDILSGRSFLIDTGAEESVYPASRQDKQKTRGTSLIAANGTNISTYVKKVLPYSLEKNATFTQEFWVADVTQPILGVDFFATHQLAIDMANKRLVSLDSSTVIHAHSSRSYASGIHKIHSRFEVILEEFPELLVPSFHCNKYGVVHYIPTKG